MMTDFELLSAYVDGELPPDERSRLETRMVSDPGLSHRAVALRLMKAGVAGIGGDTLLVTVPAVSPYRRPMLAMATAVGLSLALAFAGGWAGALSLGGRNQAATRPEALAQAVLLHDVWSRGAQATAPKPASVTDGFEAPELAEAGLALASLNTEASIDGKPAIQVGYLGQHGCRLSLFRMGETRGDAAFRIKSDAGVQSADWADASFRYIVVARHLDLMRFTVLASALNEMTTHAGQPSRQVVAGLEAAHQPCNG